MVPLCKITGFFGRMVEVSQVFNEVRNHFIHFHCFSILLFLVAPPSTNPDRYHSISDS